jgi:hypothetical protein
MATRAERQHGIAGNRSMNYTRYLDLHLCTNKDINVVRTEKMAKARGNFAAVLTCNRKFFSHGGTEYFYEFRDDMESQAKYRSNEKSEGFSYDPEAFFSKNIGNCRSFSDVEITRPDISMLRVVNGQISNELRQMRYIGCMVAIEHLQDPSAIYPNLQGLMRWVCDATTTNKMRVNCHGAGTTGGGFGMGKNDLSAEHFVGTLQRHGLARSLLPENAVVVGESMVVGIQQSSGLAQNARWKLDSEVTQCEAMGCTHKFEKSWYGSSNKHHCRRCGGIFCDRHTSRRIDLTIALTEKSGTLKGAKQVRVCDKCYAEARDQVGIRDAADPDFKYGLQTIALGLCMGAKADERFSPELKSAAEGTLAAGSLAARLRDELTQRNIRGIKITASNQIVANNASKGLRNVFGVTYQTGQRGATTTGMLDSSGEFSMPAKIWGRDLALKRVYDNLPDPKPAEGIVVYGNNLYFGLNQYPPQRSRAIIGPLTKEKADAELVRTLLNQFFQKWEFYSWNKTTVLYNTTTRPTADSAYIVLSAPPRVTSIVGDNPVQNPARDIRVTGGQVISYKLTKSIGWS